MGRGEWGGRRSGSRTGLAPLRGSSGRGRGRDPTPKGGWWGGPLGGQRIKRECGQVSPAHLDPQELVEIPGLILCPPRPPPASRSWGSGREGRGSKSKGRTSRTAPLRGGCGRGGVPTPSGTHPRLGVQWEQGRPWGRWWGRGAKEQKRTRPALSLSTRHWGACWAPGPDPLPSEPPSCHAEPKPCPYTPTQDPNSTLGDPLWDPLQHAGPKPHPHTLTQGLTSKLWNSTLWRPPIGCAESPLPHRS